jgi:hypothetical protein
MAYDAPFFLKELFTIVTDAAGQYGDQQNEAAA